MWQESTVLGDAEQNCVLRLIYERFDERGKWPTFGEIDRPARKLGLRPEGIIADLVNQHMLLPFQAGRLQPVGRDELHLTLLGFSYCKGGKDDVARLLRLLPWLAAKELNFEPEPEHPDASLRVSRTEFAEFLQLPIESNPIRRLRRLIELQRWGWSGGEFEGGEWYVQVDRNIGRFADVQTLDGYEAVMTQWEEEGKRPYVTIPDSFYGQVETFISPAQTPEPEPYISATIVGQLEPAVSQAGWDSTKLLALIGELNDSYLSGKTYSAHALLRAVLDHTPPLLGCASFAAVANNYPWTQTDKKYIKRLADFRAQADDVLHRPISNNTDLLTIDDLPQRVAANRLLQECISAVMTRQSVQSLP